MKKLFIFIILSALFFSACAQPAVTTYPTTRGAFPAPNTPEVEYNIAIFLELFAFDDEFWAYWLALQLYRNYLSVIEEISLIDARRMFADDPLVTEEELEASTLVLISGDSQNLVASIIDGEVWSVFSPFYLNEWLEYVTEVIWRRE